ncbi:SDR family NAD(P)-dependent oxidoreductase [Salinactinospora qingdaonensis]|uniref:Glucose 1-dehydrogenase n=1 Tax=Salinactinospora qingdaonensis TaxID=702744 RepID=A0ABP7GH94_9ACTN
MNRRFTDMVALVTGSGSGIGRHVALALAREGAAVVVAGRRHDRVAETVAMIEKEGGDALAIATDVTDSASVAAMVARTVEHYGGLHVAVNNAGVLTATGPVGDVDPGEWETMLATNLTGMLLSLQHEIAHMRSNGGGTIVNIASNVGASTTVPGIGAYGATKAAVSALTRAAALDHIREGVRINAVSPGVSDTPMSLLPGETDADRAQRLREQSPIGRVGSLDEIAAGVLYLASAESGYAVGTDLLLDGGAAA